jgi:hypothetical protein
MLAIGVLLLIAFIFVEAKFAELPVLPMHMLIPLYSETEDFF